MINAFNAQRDGFRTQDFYMVMDKVRKAKERDTCLFELQNFEKRFKTRLDFVVLLHQIASRVVHMQGEVVAKF